jgi:DNA-binding CsgD family transcriptional regulator
MMRAHALGLRALTERASAGPAPRRDCSVDSKVHQIVAGMIAEVERVLEEATPDNHAPSPTIAAAAALCRAEASRLAGTDPGPWAVAATLFGALGDPYHRAYCTYREAEARLARRSDRRAATTSLDEAWRTADRLGARRLRARCETLAERANVRLGGARAAGDSPKARVGEDLGLTAREVEVFERLARNCTDGEIAEELFISKKTASVHVSNILRKLDLADRRRAGAFGRDLGLGGFAARGDVAR